jgi:phosphatidate phosphatase APP1
MRWLGYGRFGHKWRTLHRILSNLDRQKCVLIGDSGEQDLQIYRRVCDTASFGARVDRILIRHVPGTPIQTATHPREIFYGQIAELRAQLDALMVQ